VTRTHAEALLCLLLTLPSAGDHAPAADQYLMNWHNSDEQKLSSVEGAKIETRFKDSSHPDTYSLREFLKIYNTSELYAASALLDTKIGEQLNVPRMLQSCAMLERIASMNLWLSSGGTSSVVHTDGPKHNLNCLIAGQKKFLLWHPNQIRTIVDPEKSGWVNVNSLPESDPLADAYGAFSGRINQEKVDLDKFPGWAEAEHYHAEVQAGDCLLIPAFWLHQVRSTGRNIALNAWWHKIPDQAAAFKDLEAACRARGASTSFEEVPWSELEEKDVAVFLKAYPEGQQQLWDLLTEKFPALAEKAQLLF